MLHSSSFLWLLMLLLLKMLKLLLISSQTSFFQPLLILQVQTLTIHCNPTMQTTSHHRVTTTSLASFGDSMQRLADYSVRSHQFDFSSLFIKFSMRHRNITEHLKSLSTWVVVDGVVGVYLVNRLLLCGC